MRSRIVIDAVAVLVAIAACLLWAKFSRATAQTAAREFFRAASAEGARAFGVDWKGQNVFVEKGDMVLARMISQTNTIYAVQILEQFGEIGQRGGWVILRSLWATEELVAGAGFETALNLSKRSETNHSSSSLPSY